MSVKSPTHRDAPTSSVRGSGFQARIKGANLADLVQMECLAGSRRVVRVTSGDQVGYLFFRTGHLVHALARSLIGEAAALEMLGWDEGTFEPAERDWPARDSIACSWQSLLLRAAQARDEKDAGSVVVLHGDGRPKSKPPPLPIGENIEFEVTPIQVAGHTLRSEDFQLFLRMNRDGVVLASHGSSQEFADIAAYALRLAQLIGDGLGIERFVAMECTFKEGRCFLVLEDSGELVALKPRTNTDASSLRELFKL
ncbi:MAG TPA: DUF4388 domain-containing protein [Polyangiaceae bacterium]|jgi:hypothetical protein|nr:DUF4388 domain-containing protein [Polyangiaceae bacterium]